MNFRFSLVLITTALIHLCGCQPSDSQKETSVKKTVEPAFTYYLCALYDSTYQIKIPFALLKSKDPKSGLNTYTIQNGSEKIKLEIVHEGVDSSVLLFPVFHSKLVLTLKDSSLRGYWNDPSRTNYTMLIEGKQAKPYTGFSGATPLLFQGKWEARFSPNETWEFPAVGVFKTDNNIFSGTFLTETGDYRFLWGYTNQDSMLLTCFDGAHAFKFEAKLQDDTLRGVFISGKHYNQPWVGWRNEKAELTHPDSLTKLKPGPYKIEISGIDVTGDSVQFPGERYENKVVLIQVMASWCPNCYDETAYLGKLYNKHQRDGLEIIGLAFERGSEQQATERIIRLAQHQGATYPFLIAGDDRKTTAESVLQALEQVKSFPTLIFIDRKGAIRKVHTGFYGPGTGSMHENFIRENNRFVENLLLEQ